jgi:hypothetical protein
MSEFKHTPGPWEIFDNDARYPGIDSASNAFSVVCFGDDDEPDYGVQGQTREEAYANARLIAEAPTMLDYITRCASNCAEANAILQRVKGEAA